MVFRVEYVDCLGRTRTCLRKDLEYLKSKDAELRSSMDIKERGSPIIPEKDPEEVEEKTQDKSEEDDALSEQNELLSSDMRREILRRQWEREEEALRDKRNIHYQDVLFDGIFFTVFCIVHLANNCFVFCRGENTWCGLLWFFQR